MKSKSLLLNLLAACASILWGQVNAATIIFQDEFSSTNAQGWTLSSGANVSASGNYAGSSGLNTDGSNDQSIVHFDADGVEIATTNLYYAAFGGGTNSSGQTISQTLSLAAGQTYNVYFRYAGSHNPGHQITATFVRGGDSSTTGALAASNTVWTTGAFAFTPSTSGNATLTFTHTSSPINSDLLFDSVVVSTIPEPGVPALLGGFGLLFLLRRRRCD